MPPIKLARKSCRREGRRRFMTMLPGCDSSSHHGWRFDGGGKRRHQKQYHDSKLVRFADFDWQTMAERRSGKSVQARPEIARARPGYASRSDRVTQNPSIASQE